MHCLDDGVLAGDAAAVAAALRLVQERGAALGLDLNLAKCELVAVGPLEAGVLHTHFPDLLLRTEDGSSRVLQNFELLGAAIGDKSFTRNHTAEGAGRPAGCAG